MKEVVSIYYLGLCENPDCKNPFHSVPVHACVTLEDLPEKCGCGARIRWETGIHRHNMGFLKKKSRPSRAVWIALAVVLVLVGGIAAFFSYQIFKDHTPEEMSVVLEELKGTTCDQILDKMVEAGISERKIASVLSSYPSVIHRIRTGKTAASPQFENVLKGVYSDFILTGLWSVVLVKYSLITRPDPFIVGIHSFQEVALE